MTMRSLKLSSTTANRAVSGPDIAMPIPNATAPGHVDCLGAADQHPLWIAAAQGAGSTEREVIDDRNRPTF